MTLEEKIKRIKELMNEIPEVDSINLMNCDVNEVCLLTKPEKVDTGASFYYRGTIEHDNGEIVLFSETNKSPIKVVSYEIRDVGRSEDKDIWELEDVKLNNGLTIDATVERSKQQVSLGFEGDASIRDGLNEYFGEEYDEWEVTELAVYDDGMLVELSEKEEFIYEQLILESL